MRFTEADWQRLFQAYVAVHKSHWTGPPFAFVRKQLEEKGAYEFSVPAMGTWTSRFRLEVRDGEVIPVFVKNPALQGRMKAHLDAMERAFHERI